MSEITTFHWNVISLFLSVLRNIILISVATHATVLLTLNDGVLIVSTFYLIVPSCLPANSSESKGDLSVHGARPLAEVTTSDKLHYIIDSPKGVVQIGKCCVLLQVNFSSPIVNRLLEEGDINCKLHGFRHFFGICSNEPYFLMFYFIKSKSTTATVFLFIHAGVFR